MTSASDPLDGGGERTRFGRSDEDQSVGDTSDGACGSAREEPSEVDDHAVGDVFEQRSPASWPFERCGNPVRLALSDDDTDVAERLDER